MWHARRPPPVASASGRTQAVAGGALPRGTAKAYAAFLSYSHAVDGKLAPAMQAALHGFAKPWYRRRAIRVFRDEASMSVNPALWSTIEAALSDADFFILLASPEAATSEWVNREVTHWLATASPDRLLVVLTSGQITWDAARGDFDWERTTALPPRLAGVFREEPLHLDLRWARAESQLTSKDPRFHAVIADLAATVRGWAKDDIIGEDVRQHRRTVRLAWSAVAALTALAVAASATAVLFLHQRDVAQHREREARQHLYTAHVNQALIAARSGDMERAATILDAQSPKHGRPDLRGFEWYYLWRESHREIASYRAPALATLAFSPDGRLLAAGGTMTPPAAGGDADPGDWVHRGEIRVWHVESGRMQAASTHDRRISAIAFGPDGRTLAAVTQSAGVAILEGNDVMLLDAESGAIRWRQREPGTLATVAFHPAGGMLATGGQQTVDPQKGHVVLWNAGDGLRTGLELGPIGWIRSLAFSPDGAALAVAWDGGPGSHRSEVGVWNLAARSWSAKVAGRGKLVTSALFVPDGTRLLVGDEEGIVTAWNLETASEDAVFRGHRGPLHSLAAAKEPIVATGGWDRTVRVWHAHTGQVLATLPRQPNAVDSVAFSPDGRTLATASNADVKLWSVAEELGHASALSAHRTRLNAVAFSPDGTLLGTGGEEGTVTVWDVSSRESRKTFELGGGSRGVLALEFSPDGTRLAATSDAGTAVWSVETGRAEYRDRDGSAEALAFLPEGNRLIVGTGRGVFLVDVSRSRSTRVTRRRAEVVAVSPDGRTLATAWGSSGPGESDVLLWSLPHGRQSCVLRGHDQGVLGLAFSPDGALLASGGYGSHVKLWTVAACREHATLPEHAGVVESLAFSPDGRTLAVAHAVLGLAEHGYLTLWSTATWEELLRLPTDMGNVRAVAFSPTGRMLAAGGDNDVVDAVGKVRLWLAGDG